MLRRDNGVHVKNKVLITLGVLMCHCLSRAISNDRQAYEYCISNETSYIAIIWPMAQGKDNTIEKILHKYGTIKYKKRTYLNYEQAFTLLKDAHPHITDMQSHMELYFPEKAFGKLARIYLMSFANLETAVKCKRAIRHIFDMGYTSIHMNDYHHEVIKLAQFFFNESSKKYVPTSIRSDYDCGEYSYWSNLYDAWVLKYFLRA